MKNIKINILAILITFAVIPAWGMDYCSRFANLAVPLLPVMATAYIFSAHSKNLNVKPDGVFIPSEEKDKKEIKRIFINTFGFVPPSYHEIKDGGLKGRIWKHEDRIQGALLFSKKSPTKIYVERLAVDTNNQHHGIGTKMMNALENEFAATCPQSSCTITLHSYEKAITFYEKLGFTCGDLGKCEKVVSSTMKNLNSNDPHIKIEKQNG